jgi:isopenicillin N synthase-like dioxygenase
VNHGVPQPTIDAMLAASTDFFSLRMSDKLALHPDRAEINRGYAAKGSESLNYSLGVAEAPPDLFEAFNIGPDVLPEGDPAYDSERHRLFAPNIWPEHPASFRPALVAYFDEMQRLTSRLTEVFAMALGLAPDFFAIRSRHPVQTMRVLNYETAPGDPEPLDGQQRMGAHTDYGISTILYADPVPGLQIVGPDDQWHDVIPLEGAFLVNLGDQLSQWTNDRWRSTLHRVVPPERSLQGPSKRRSVAFFHDGDGDVLVECLATCCSVDNPPRYAPVLAVDHLMGKLLGPRLLQASIATSTAGDRPIN